MGKASMTKVLVVDDQHDHRRLLVDTLSDAGYEVIEAKNGSSAIEMARNDLPDIILLDVWMPEMDGFEVLRTLRENPSTQAIPVILLTAMRQRQGARRGWEMGVRHYIEKPFDTEHVKLTIKVALREQQNPPDGGMCHDTSQNGAHDLERGTATRTGHEDLDRILGGGIPLGSLTLIEGTPSSGKSVLCQHITYESLLHGRGVAYFTSNNTPNGLIIQMSSIGMNLLNYRRSDMLRIDSLEHPTLDEACEFGAAPENPIISLAQQIKRLPREYETIVVDAVTELSSNVEDKVISGFFSNCRLLCEEGRTIVLVVHSYAFREKLLERVRDLCDVHFSLRLKQFPGRLGATLEVRKAPNIELNEDNTVGFEVVARLGVQPLPVAKVLSVATKQDQDTASVEDVPEGEDTRGDDDLLSLQDLISS